MGARPVGANTRYAKAYRERQMAIDPDGYRARRAAANKAWRTKYLEEQRARCRNLPRERRMLYEARSRAKKFGLPFNLEESDIVIPSNCPVLGIPIERGNGKLVRGSPTLDRLIPELGYTKGNVAVISFRANSLKSNASAEELETVAEWMRTQGL